MCRYFIEKIQVGLTDSGIPDRNVLVTIQYHKNDNPSQWLSNADCGGICNIFLNDYNAFELLLSGDAEDPQWGVGMTNSFEGIDFFDYEDMFEYFLNNPEATAVPLMRLLIALTRCSDEEAKSLISNAEGKFVDEIDIPISDIEEDYLFENE